MKITSRLLLRFVLIAYRQCLLTVFMTDRIFIKMIQITGRMLINDIQVTPRHYLHPILNAVRISVLIFSVSPGPLL